MTAIERAALDRFASLSEREKSEYERLRKSGDVGKMFAWLRRHGFIFDAETGNDLAARFIMLLQELERG